MPNGRLNRARSAAIAWGGVSTLALTFATAAAAQTQAPAAPAAAEPVATVQEVIVTAQKRQQSINTVGMTITALGGSALKSRQINSLADLAQAVPSLSFSNSAYNTPVYTLRGVGFYETSLGAYPTVSVYLDEIPLPFPALTKHSGYDLDRVEVLKGPQGTLFGQNATGGAINYIAAKPTDHFTAGASLSYGRFNQTVDEVYVSGPITDTLTGRVVGRIEEADGWQRSNSRPGATNGSTDNYMGRILLDWKPVNGVKFELNLNGWRDRSQTQAPQFIGTQIQTPGYESPNVSSAAYTPKNDRAADWTPGAPRADNRFFQAALRGDFALTSGLTLTSLTSYVDYRQNQGEDEDGLPAVTYDLPGDVGAIRTFTQELRIANGSQGHLRWVAGANFEHSTVDQKLVLTYPDASIAQYLHTVGFPVLTNTFNINQVMQNTAVFGNVEYDPTETLTLKAGARYTESDRSANSCNADVTAPYAFGGFFYDAVLGGALGAYPPGSCFAINTVGGSNLINAPGLGKPGRFQDKLDQNNVSWRVGLDWKPFHRTLFYVNVSKGYKAGSFPAVGASTFQQYLPVTQESVLSYEGGFKTKLWDGRLQFNGAGFYYDYNDKQLRSKLVDPVFGILDVLQNIPKSSIAGGEIELVATPVSGLTLSVDGTYLDAKIDRFKGINAAGVAANFAGATIPFTPKWQVGANADYEFPLNDRLNGFAGVTVSYRSSAVSVVGGSQTPASFVGETKNPYVIDGYTLVDLRGGVSTRDGRWKFELWGKNIFNTYYWTNVFEAYDTVGRFTGMPATYGATVNFKFD
ncbi:MAG: TonB-dependent receptor [Caulobacteraceae bacterium]|nr:TonB-dependent receptor [Caulobacteraceae bacterium]